MTTTMVTFLQACGDDGAGETKRIPMRRAQRLVQQGYARVVEEATVSATETAEEKRPAVRAPKPERRG